MRTVLLRVSVYDNRDDFDARILIILWVYGRIFDLTDLGWEKYWCTDEWGKGKYLKKIISHWDYRWTCTGNALHLYLKGHKMLNHHKRFFLLFSIGILSLLLTWCWITTHQLAVRSLDFSRDAELIPEMKRTKTLNQRISYQEVNQDKSATLDSLIIDEVSSSVPLVSYMQQSLNQLRLYGCQISQETTKKSSIQTSGSHYPTILKTYSITDPRGLGLYAAQYAIDMQEKVLLISYTSTNKSNRSTFIKSLEKISFIR